MKIETEKYKEALTDEDIEVWAEKEFGDSMVIPEIAAMAGAKAFRDGLIKHLEAITAGGWASLPTSSNLILTTKLNSYEYRECIE